MSEIVCKRCGSPELWREGLTNMNSGESKYKIEFIGYDGEVGIRKEYHRVFCADCTTEFYLHPTKGMIEQ